jgi:hypothetical protein
MQRNFLMLRILMLLLHLLSEIQLLSYSSEIIYLIKS